MDEPTHSNAVDTDKPRLTLAIKLLRILSTSVQVLAMLLVPVVTGLCAFSYFRPIMGAAILHDAVTQLPSDVPVGVDDYIRVNSVTDYFELQISGGGLRLCLYRREGSGVRQLKDAVPRRPGAGIRIPRAATLYPVKWNGYESVLSTPGFGIYSIDSPERKGVQMIVSLYLLLLLMALPTYLGIRQLLKRRTSRAGFDVKRTEGDAT